MRAAMVHVEDRGYQFADGVYEVCEVRGRPPGRRAAPHGRGCSARSANCASRMPMSPAALGVVMRETVARNRVRDGIVYLQVTRGVARRDHAFPPPGTAPSLVVTARSTRPRREREQPPPRASRSSPCRTTAGRASTSSRSRCCPTCSPSRRRASRAPGSLVRRRARAASPRAPRPMPGSSPRDGEVVTRPADHGILRGITRDRAARRRSRRRGSSSRSAPSPSRRPMRRARPSSPRRARSSCRWCASTAARSATVRPGLIATRAAARFPSPRRIGR